MADTFAIVRDSEILDYGDFGRDEAAQDWYQQSPYYGRASLVVLDLACDQTPRVGQRVQVDDEGIADLVVD